MRKYRFGIVFAVLLCGWMALIFLLSAQTAAESSSFSGGFSNRLFWCIVPDFRTMSVAQKTTFVKSCSFLVRKAAHFGIYTVLGFLAHGTAKGFVVKTRLCPVLAAAFCVLYAMSDEFHQRFVAGRSGEWRDVLLDSVGAFCGVALFWLGGFILNKRRERRKKQ